MSNDRKTIVLPVETMAREFDGKLLLALCARERGWNVLIGNEATLIKKAMNLPPCLYFGKSARLTNVRFFRWLRSLGHSVVVLDEEALVRQSDEIYQLKHERDALKHVNLLLCWGPSNLNFWQKSDYLNGLYAESVGNPRVDMLRQEIRSFHEPEIASIQSRFGDYVLFNTNFATVNSFMTGTDRLKLASWVPDNKVDEAKELLAHKRTIFERFQELIPEMSAAIYPRHLVIRPHPSERHAPWRSLASALPNVTVIFEGSVVPWIAGARALIHNGCTSSVEAAVLGTPVITYRPITSEKYDNPLPNSLGVECFDNHELIIALMKLISDSNPLMEIRRDLISEHITLPRDRLCCDLIMDAIERHELSKLVNHRTNLKTWISVFAESSRRSFKKWLKKFGGKGSSRVVYKRHKFSDVSSEFADERIQRFCRALGRFEGFRAIQRAPDLLEIMPISNSNRESLH